MSFVRVLSSSFVVVSILLAVPACNCGEVPLELPPTPTLPTGTLSCTPDAELITERRECRRDDQCPCGAHCERGLCAATCMTSDDCGEGLNCDGFGRCREGDVGKQVIARNNRQSGRPRIMQAAIARGGTDQPRLMTIIADDARINSARIVADPGTEVARAEESTDPDALDYTSEVIIEDPIEEGGSVNVYVRTTNDDDPAAIEAPVSVTVYTEDNRSTSVDVIDTARFAGLPSTEPTPLEGTYEGFAKLALTGVASGFLFNGGPPERDVSTLLTAQVFPAASDRAVIVITDPLHLLHPSGQWVGEIILGDAPRVEMPAFEQVPSSTALGAQIHVTAVAADGVLISDPQGDNWPGTLRFKLALSFQGAAGSRNGPQQRWELALGRTGDLPPGSTAPSVDTAAVLDFDADVEAATPLPREAAFLEAIDGDINLEDVTVPSLAWRRLRSERTSATPVCKSLDALFAPNDGLGLTQTAFRSVFLGAFSSSLVADTAGTDVGGFVEFSATACVVSADCTASPFPTNQNVCGSNGICTESEEGPDRIAIDFDMLKSKGGSAHLSLMNAPTFSSWIDAIDLTVDDGVSPIIRDVLHQGIGFGPAGKAAHFDMRDGSVLDFAVPCAMNFEDAVYNDPAPNNGHTFTLDESKLELDVCESMTADYECTVVDLEGFVDRAQLEIDSFSVFCLNFDDGTEAIPSNDQSCFSIDTNEPLPTISKACVFSPLPSACVEATFCDDASDTGDFGLDPLGQGVDPITGDLRCEDGGAGLIFPMDAPGTLNPPTRSAADVRSACQDDFFNFNTLPPPVTGTTMREKLDSIGWGGGAGCIDVQRFLAQLPIAGTSARTLGGLTTIRNDDEADAIFIRLLQRYFQVLNFMTSDALTGATLEADDDGTGGGLAMLEDALATSTEGWDLILLPRIGASLAGLSGTALADPDYRRRILTSTPTVAPHQTQEQGVAVAMMELLATQMELLQLVVDRHARSGAREAPESVANALRVMGLVEAQVVGLVDRARTADDGLDPRWLPRHDLAKGRFEGARARAFLSLNAAVRGANPLGIEEDDLPLYFSEVATDAGSRFTAISSFILGDGPISNAAAPSAVRIAGEAFELARTSRLTEEQRLVNIENDEADFEVAKEAARNDLGALVQDYCGPTYFGGAGVQAIATRVLEQPTVAPSAGGGAVNFENCWRVEDPVTCPPEETITEAFETQRAIDRTAEEAALIASVENGLRNSLCLGTLTAAPGPLPEDIQCQDDLPFVFPEPGPFDPPDRPDDFTGRGCAADPSFLYWGVCRPPPNNNTRLTAGSPALRKLEAELYARFGNEMTLEAKTFVPSRRSFLTCSELPMTEVVVPAIPFGPQTLNFCLNTTAPNGPGGLFPSVTYVPGRPPSETDPGGTDAKITLTCDPIIDPGNPIVIEVTADELTTDINPDVALKEQCDSLFVPEFLGFKSERRNFQVTNAFCFRGSLGAEAATMTTLNGEIEAANAEVGDMFEEYSISQNTCKILARGNATLQQAESAFAEEIIALRSAKAAMDSAAAVAGAAKDCLGTLSGVGLSPETVVSGAAIVSTKLAAGSCVFAGVEAGFAVASFAIDAAMGNLENRHEVAKLAIENASEEKQCFNEAELALVGLQTQRLRIQIALQELQNALAAFVASTQQAESELARELANVATADDSLTVTINADPLLGRDNERLRGAMRLARRNSYLAVRAVEYEFQQSLSDRGVVLLSENPDQLEDVLDNLRSIAFTGSPNGNRPTELTAVFSMRQHLLQLAGAEESVPDTEQQLTEEDRFRMLLLDPRFEVFEKGEFIGREIPFQVAPLGELNLGESVGVPIVADNSCAERLWSLNVSILGDPDTMFTGFAPLVNLEVRKRNTFFANYCSANADPFQVASTRPSKNLFREPGIAEGFSLQGGSQTDLMSKARIQALLNIEPGEFITDAYVDGASTELAGRLLFGDYSLFIPAGSIALVDDEGAATSDGLLLSEIDDIAIRLDYLSVAR